MHWHFCSGQLPLILAAVKLPDGVFDPSGSKGMVLEPGADLVAGVELTEAGAGRVSEAGAV
ncbi:hypothetical protein GCM10010156_65770 [Planobispora rosea]|uniref:Uncharacterized protein n=1 Tax=Planobispora rosea TaxID=35762 RepID=A0A8J3S6U1_PLARO|nr:hypothetical protein GCM10010156_65770 [Planobispora rosea]GIH87884.1 hypothetical protein Pro02_62920 [Planobispora rosea]